MRKHSILAASLVLALLASSYLYNRRAPEPASAVPVSAPWLKRVTAEMEATRPNILLVVYDTRRRDDFSFGSHANQRNDTPFLAAIAEDATYFPNAVAPGVWTAPLHASIFSGLSVCELGIDLYNPGFAVLPEGFLSLAEVLRLSGYRTIAIADHPFFYAYPTLGPKGSLIRGFERFSVINDFQEFGTFTNIGTADGGVEHRHDLAGLDAMPFDEAAELIRRFNAGGLRFDLAGADFDRSTGIYLPKLGDLYDESEYFERRYRRPLDGAFAGHEARPYFLFVNLHMCTEVANPEPRLFARWVLRTLMLNAQHAGRRLELPEERADLMAGLLDNWRRLGLRTGVPGSPYRSVKHVFDTRFFDECFRRIAEYLAERDPERDTVTVVLSDHGLSFSEHGELGYLHSGGRPYEYLARVPLLLQFPPQSELAALHGRYDQPVSLTDLFSTILDLGLGPDVFERELPIRGQSLIRRLRDSTFDDLLVTEAALLPMPYQEWPGVVAYSKAVYADGMKLIFAPKLLHIADGKTWWPFQLRLDAEPTAWEQGQRPPEHEALAGPLALLYDLTADPAERRNLAKNAPETVARLRDLVDGSWSCEPVGTSTTRVDFDPEALETLRALGYVQAPPPSGSRR